MKFAFPCLCSSDLWSFWEPFLCQLAKTALLLSAIPVTYATCKTRVQLTLRPMTLHQPFHRPFQPKKEQRPTSAWVVDPTPFKGLDGPCRGEMSSPVMGLRSQVIRLAAPCSDLSLSEVPILLEAISPRAADPVRPQKLP